MDCIWGRVGDLENLYKLTFGVQGAKISEMKKILAILLAFVPVCANAYVEKSSAIIKVMNKDAGKVQELVVPVGQSVDFEKINITVRSCMQSDPFDAENYFAFFEITEQEKGKIFSNWMNRNEPGNKPLQHPDYDLWLVGCQ